MDVFLSTISQISATLLALLAASYAAYAIFLNQQAAKFDDQIAHDKVEIHDRLWAIKSQWPQSLGMFLNPQFKDTYRSYLGGTGGSAFTKQAAIDFLFGNESMQRALQDVRANDTMPGPEYGRVFLWTMSEVVSLITRDVGTASNQQLTMFPSSASGLGFEDWRRDFEESQTVFTLLPMRQDLAIQDFDRFLETRPHGQRSVGGAFVINALKSLYESNSSIRESLRDIDEQALLRKPYLLAERTHNTWILASMVLGLIVGVITPLFLLLINVKASAIGGMSLLVAAFALTLGGIAVFGWDVVGRPTFDAHSYISNRWCVPLREELKSSESRLQDASLLDLDLFYDASGARDLKSLPNDVDINLKRYLASAQRYNRAASDWNSKIVDTLKKNPSLPQQAPGETPASSSISLTPAQIFAEPILDRAERDLKNNRQLGLSMEVGMPRWHSVFIRFSQGQINKDKDSRITALRDTAKTLEVDALRIAFDRAKEELSATRETLNSALQGCK